MISKPISISRVEAQISGKDIEQFLSDYLACIPTKLKKILIIPPDFTRYHSGSGEISRLLYSFLSPHSQVDLLPALGTHHQMTTAEKNKMFPGIPHERIFVHNWEKNLSLLGTMPAQMVKEISDGKVNYSVQIEVNHLLAEGNYDAIFSIGQVVPQEVSGMAGGNKNILIGIGGVDIINKSHFLGAVCNLEKIMGRINNPVRKLLNKADDQVLSSLPIHYILTVCAMNEKHQLITRGLFGGTDRTTFKQAALLSQSANIKKIKPQKKVVVFLDPNEYKTTWLGNKAIYRTRMALANNGELIIMAPGLIGFGESQVQDRLIRRHGYHGTEATLRAIKQDPELHNNLGAAAHLIHGSSEGRFRICLAPGGLSQEEVESVGFRFLELSETLSQYNPEKLSDGLNRMPDGETIYFISNPALGLWQAEV